MMRYILLFLALLPAAAWGATYYVGPAATGTGTGADRSNLIAFASVDSGNQSGNTFMLQPGNYGAMAFDSYGSEGSRAVYQADPGTTISPHGDNWLHDPSAVTRPVLATPGLYVLSTGVTIAAFGTGDGAGSASGNHLTIDGVHVVDDVGGVTGFDFGDRVAYVTIANCSVFGRRFSDETITHYFNEDWTSRALSVYTASGTTGEADNVIITNSYFDWFNIGAQIYAPAGAFTVSGCHFYQSCNGSFSLINSSHANAGIVISGCHIHGKPPHQVADAGNPQLATAVSEAGGPASTTFSYTGDPGSYVTAGDSVKVTHGGVDALRVIGSITKPSGVCVVSEAFPFDVEVGDAVVFYEGEHGSAVALKGSNITLRGNYIHNQGNTGTVYSYITDAENWLIENNVIYAPAGAAAINAITSAPTYGMLGNNITIRNNTIVGNVPESGQVELAYYDATEKWNYGRSLWIMLSDSADKSTLTVTNNLLVGHSQIRYQTDSESADDRSTIRNNHVYHSEGGFETDADGSNQGNVIYHQSGGIDSETEFNSGWFAGGVTFMTEWLSGGIMTTIHNSEWALLPTAPGVDAGSYISGHYAATDVLGNGRDVPPDVGAFEYIKRFIIGQ